MEALIPLIAMFGLMWLLLIRPQQRRMRQHQATISALKVGDEVITAGGLHGVVTEVEGDTVLVEISPDVIVRVLTTAISQRLIPPEELDQADSLDEVDGPDEPDDAPATEASVKSNGATPAKIEPAGDDKPQ